MVTFDITIWNCKSQNSDLRAQGRKQGGGRGAGMIRGKGLWCGKGEKGVKGTGVIGEKEGIVEKGEKEEESGEKEGIWKEGGKGEGRKERKEREEERSGKWEGMERNVGGYK